MSIPFAIFEKSPFVEGVVRQRNEIGFRNENVRRPLFGISIKAPKPSFISVFQSNNENNLVPISLRDSSAPEGHSQANHNYILQTVEYQRQEKYQIVETFGDHFTFFFGERPIILQASGVLFNTRDFNWANEWDYNYENFLRGTKAVENRSRVFLAFDDVLASGFLLTTNNQRGQDQPYLVPFSFQMLLTNLTRLDDANQPIREASDGRQLNDGRLVEYVSDVVLHEKWVINPLTGESERESGATGNVPGAINDSGFSQRTAFWTSDRDPTDRQWLTPEEALVILSNELTAQEAGSDSITSRLALKADPTQFPFGTRNSAVETLDRALTTGVANAAAVIVDAPALP